jgi:hypothetical protein
MARSLDYHKWATQHRLQATAASPLVASFAFTKLCDNGGEF